jgi:hypothetical protein
MFHTQKCALADGCKVFKCVKILENSHILKSQANIFCRYTAVRPGGTRECDIR